ncbi:DUF4391 domain-containing protein [Vibrio sp. 1636]|uniref:DUF4391 domain-containing protein n=1 Tax=Vibrio alginolyticus TaxID=663 RepID=A0A7Y0MWJ6_VIBAL|nr:MULTISPECIES: DUF4391 domain-containing protein [Vibrio]EHR5478126.1 DUF4391 domain-containing protein [Vibrio parahaemolyticus]MDW2202530.1 DUF4391 domain-containing protein [Vibrio sp. 1636]NMR74486.1 DUF4391 domain-containing protein [Vibrio alginolyticus]
MASAQQRVFIPFRFPGAAALGSQKQGQKIPKETIYQQSNPTSAIKQLFVNDVEQIVWRYKLSPDTLNVAECEDVAEIQVFDIHLKPNCRELDVKVLETLDRAVPSNIFFRVFNGLQHRPQVQHAMAYKRENKRDAGSMVIKEYFLSDWVAISKLGELNHAESKKLPVIINMATLYNELLRSLLPEPALEGESLDEQMKRIAMLNVCRDKLAKLQAKQRKEKQYNRRVDMNSEINRLKEQISSLSGL